MEEADEFAVFWLVWLSPLPGGSKVTVFDGVKFADPVAVAEDDEGDCTLGNPEIIDPTGVDSVVLEEVTEMGKHRAIGERIEGWLSWFGEFRLMESDSKNS